MSAKKKAPKMTRGESAAMVIDRWAAMESELDRLRKQVFSTESDLMRMEKLLNEANARLAAKERELASCDRTITAFSAERDFLWEEIDRFRNRVMDYIRWQALLPEDALLALSKVTAQEFEDELDEDAEES